MHSEGSTFIVVMFYIVLLIVMYVIMGVHTNKPVQMDLSEITESTKIFK